VYGWGGQAETMRTVRRADRVVFLDGGRIVEEGSHDELLRRDGRYADFWRISGTPSVLAGDRPV
jgi:ATP-binding cassette, subfamily B, bacterial IrtB/YbtQ